jgi:predicted lipoprotein with Yx(FWY)xxD motif
MVEVEMRKLLQTGVLAIGLLAAGCGATGEGEEAGPIAAEEVKVKATPAQEEAVAKIQLAETRIGKILAGEDGHTLYLFEKDKKGKSSCSGACARAWPPYLTEGKPKAGEGVKASLLGTIKRSDGTKQVTYHDHPLYFYIQDKQPGDTTGNDVKGFGAEWYALTAKGHKPRS